MESVDKQPQEAFKNENLLVQISVFASAVGVLSILSALIFITLVQNPGFFVPSATFIEPIAVVEEVAEDRVENGMDVASGLIAEGEYLVVKRSCTACHSGKLVTQNRASREGWLEMIRWMQETQKLWDLGPAEDKILDYLATHYGPQKKGRRATLVVDEWYMIE